MYALAAWALISASLGSFGPNDEQLQSESMSARKNKFFFI